MGEGDRFMAVSRMLPDLSFTGSSASSPSVDITVKTRNYPGGDFIDTSTDAVSRSSTSSTVPFEQFTDKVDLRLRGMSVAIKILSSDTGVQWRMVSHRIYIRPDGRRYWLLEI